MVNVAGFENTIAVSQKLKGMLQQFGNEILSNPDQFISLMNDYIPEYEKERRLLKNVTKSGVLTAMQRGDNQKISVMKSKEYMMNEMFLSEGAVEFVMVCFTYLLDWPYETTMPEQGAVAAPAQAFPAQPQFVNANPFSPPPAAGGFSAQPMAQPMPNMQTAMPQQPVPAPQRPAPAPQPVVENPIPEIDETQIFRNTDAARSRLKGTVKIPGGYMMLDNFCFDGFKFMKNVELPSSMVVIGQYAFSECKRLKNIAIPPSVRSIGQGAFSECAKLNKINIPAGVTEIADMTFQFCYDLEIVDLPNTIISIGSGAFEGCDNLRKLMIPDSVKQIEEDAFAQCKGLVIKCYDKSYVQRYCMEMDIKTEIINRNGRF
ncbi:MAG: leucine-rich repeat domain-containing protein [Oscillospiraceae bacterium]|nr:leucine-rich repeat domain-containing protein [Oscillospiraceae bacterium]MDE5885255.1 leucine-rich repeat domain-containing protein [Oscillospiraceae bacterium]